MDYKFLTNLQEEFALPEKGILSHVLQKDDYVNITLVRLLCRRRTFLALRANTGHPLFPSRRGQCPVGSGYARAISLPEFRAASRLEEKISPPQSPALTPD